MPLGPMKTKKQKRKGMKMVMDEFKGGNLRSGSKSGPRVRNRKQAIAIGLNQTGQSNRNRGMGGNGTKRRSADKNMSVAEFEKKHGDDYLG